MRHKLPIILISLIVLIIGACSCSSMFKKPEIKVRPYYSGVDAGLNPYVKEFLDLAYKHRILFNNRVSMGFTEITRRNVIGLCTYGYNWREIDIDREFYDGASGRRKKALIFHELAHCYCNRDHDFAKGQFYPDGKLRLFVDQIKSKVPASLAKQPPGYLADGCPVTIMHPVIVEDYCLDKHWNDYVKEMFDRCEPY